MPDAIVLGGGGSKGAFQVGALEYLYEAGLRPEIICGTSSGALAAVKLAEAPHDPGQPGKIRELWEALKDSTGMFQLEPWFEGIPSALSLLAGTPGLLGASGGMALAAGGMAAFAGGSALVGIIPLLVNAVSAGYHCLDLLGDLEAGFRERSSL